MDMLGRRALVTGASSGIGAAVVRRLLREGALIVGVARRVDRLRALAVGEDQADRLLPIAADLNVRGKPQRIIEAAIAWAGGLDILVNNAGLSRGAALERSDPDDLRAMLETNVWSLVELCRLAIPHLKAASPADILNIGSVAARAMAPDSSVYSATKAAVAAFSETLRRELAADGVRVTVIHPGLVQTEFFDGQRDAAKREASRKAMEQVGGGLRADDCADLVHYVLTRAPEINLGEVIIRPTKMPL